MVFNHCSESRRLVSLLPFAVWKCKPQCGAASPRLSAFLVFQKGLEETEERTLSRKLEGVMAFLSLRQEVAYSS